MRSYLLILSAISLSVCFTFSTTESLLAQTPNFNEAERFTAKSMHDMSGSTEVYPHWIENQDRFWYSYETPDGKNWYFVNADKKSKRDLFHRKVMAAKLSEIFHKPFNYKDLPLKEFKYKAKKERFTFHVDSINFKYDLDTDNLIKGDSVKEKSSDHWKTYSPDSTWIAFSRKHNLYLMKANDPDSTEYQLTHNGERWYSYQADEGDTTSTKRLRSGARWFKDSKKLYINRQDSRKVKPLWVIHSLKNPRPTLETYKYPMPGDKDIPIDEVWAFNADTLANTKGVKLQTDKKSWKDETIGGAFFNQGGFFTGTGSDYLYMLRRNREWNKIDILKSNTSTGQTQVVFSEEDKPYFNTRFAQLAVINHGEHYLWWSERSGWGQLYRYDSNGKLENRITRGFYNAGQITKIDTTAKTVFFEGYGREKGLNPYYAQLYKIKFDGSGMKRITPEDANHDVSASDKGTYFVDNYSRIDMPTQSVLRNGNGNIIQKLEQTDVSQMKKIGWKAPESFTVKAADNATDIYGVMWKPFDFDSTKSYPIITYVYPGPQVEPFPINFSYRANTALAQLGFIVVAMGQRGGSPLRSKYYHNFGYGNLRDYPLKDNKYGIEELAAQHHYIDLNRVGIYGHSGGGFMSTAEMLTYPDFYDVGWSESGNHDNNIYNLWWSEVHNGVKESTKKIKVDDGHGGKKDSTVTIFKAPIETNIDLAKNLKGHLMLVTGTADDNVNPANTIRMANALIQAHKRFDYMILPDKPHSYGNYRPYVERRRWDYFARYLLGYQPNDINYDIPEDDD